jgi:enoyl-CoA hydratase
MTDSIRAERIGRVAVITVDAPGSRNALTLDLSAQLTKAVTDAEQDENVHALVVTGTPPAFCAGADLSTLGEAKEQGLRAIYDGFLAVARCALPTIAAVGGAAVGAGLNLALAADVRLAGPHAKFVARFLELGIHPGGGMTWMIQHAVGRQQAAAMTLFGEVLDADAAVRVGLALRQRGSRRAVGSRAGARRARGRGAAETSAGDQAIHAPHPHLGRALGRRRRRNRAATGVTRITGIRRASDEHSGPYRRKMG